MIRIRDTIHSENSIDDLVNGWSDIPYLTTVAKYCIAAEILQAESNSYPGPIGTDMFNTVQLEGRPATAMNQFFNTGPDNPEKINLYGATGCSDFIENYKERIF
ncbi:hypothetical protein D3Y57_16755 [Sphingomonas paeninsulae]|uniref:Uncharacterized protein n=2 Tax=Sphingomonas paeninsulae TaxID=2319844 RepID=A0A494TIV1_SPHPE|nr:hypothetical protein D3Y57_16755 [Sphingomonas paeninsulae]